MRHFYFALLVSLSISQIFASDDREFSLMSFNVENLFDTEKSQFYNDADFTPTGRYEWTNEKLHWKLQNLSEIVLSVRNKNEKKCPDALALSEVENREVLVLWRDLFLSDCQYQEIIIFEPASRSEARDDRRGIKVALMTRYPLAESPQFHLLYPGSRHILEVHLLVGTHPLILFINHWKSRIGGGEDKRILAAEFLKKRTTEILSQDPYFDFVVLGDFNDEPENVSLGEIIGQVNYPSDFLEDLEATRLYNVSFEKFHLGYLLERAQRLIQAGRNWRIEEVEAEIRKRRATYYYKSRRQHLQFDHFLLSRGLFDQTGLRYKPMSFEVVRHPRYTDENLAPIPFRPFSGGAQGGASDHFPILMRMLWR